MTIPLMERLDAVIKLWTGMRSSTSTRSVRTACTKLVASIWWAS